MIEIGEERARSGHTGDGVRAMLGWGIAAVAFGLFATLIVFGA